MTEREDFIAEHSLDAYREHFVGGVSVVVARGGVRGEGRGASLAEARVNALADMKFEDAPAEDTPVPVEGGPVPAEGASPAPVLEETPGEAAAASPEVEINPAEDAFPAEAPKGARRAK